MCNGCDITKYENNFKLFTCLLKQLESLTKHKMINFRRSLYIMLFSNINNYVMSHSFTHTEICVKNYMHYYQFVLKIRVVSLDLFQNKNTILQKIWH